MTALALFNALFAPWKAKRTELKKKRLTRLRRAPCMPEGNATRWHRREHGGYGERYAGFL